MNSLLSLDMLIQFKICWFNSNFGSSKNYKCCTTNVFILNEEGKVWSSPSQYTIPAAFMGKRCQKNAILVG